MAKMKTLTVSGQTYTVCDPEAVSFQQAQPLTPAQQQTARENIGVWSGKDVADKLCPTFTENGAVVTCEPVEGYPLEVVSSIVPVQSGSGEPSPDNIRPISGHSAVKLTHANDADSREFTLDLGRTVYGGSLNWTTGVLTIGWADVYLDETAAWSTTNIADLKQAYIKNFPSIPKSVAYCDKYPYGGSTSGLTRRIYMGQDLNIYDVFTTREEWLAHIAANPIHVAYQVKEPITVQLTPQEILALSGVNTFCSDSGDTTVEGKADPSAIIEKLTNAIIALGGNV